MPSLSIATDAFKQALRVVAAVIAQEPGGWEIGRRLLLSGDKGGFQIRAGDPDLQVTLVGDATGELAPTVLDYDFLYNLTKPCARSETHQPIHFARNGNKAVINVAGQGVSCEAGAPGLVPAPLLGEEEDDSGAVASHDSAQLWSALGFVRLGLDKGEEEASLRSLAFSGDLLIGLSRHRAHITAGLPKFPSKGREALIPLRAALALQVVLGLPGHATTETWLAQGRVALFQTSRELLGVTLAARTVEAAEPYPDVRKKIPKGKPLATVTVPLPPLLEAVKAAAAKKGPDGPLVRLTVGKAVRLESIAKHGDAEGADIATVECDRSGDQETLIRRTFNAAYLLAAIREMDEAVVIGFAKDAEGPLFIRCKGGKSALVMPLRRDVPKPAAGAPQLPPAAAAKEKKAKPAKEARA